MQAILSSTRKKELSSQQGEELQALESNYHKEYQSLESAYAEKFLELELKSKSLEDDLNSKHTREMEHLYNYLEQKLPRNIKYSKSYFNLLNQEKNLANQHNFIQACIVRKKRQECEKRDEIKFNNDKSEKIKSQSIKTANKHLNEKTALKRKMQIEFEVLQKQKKIDFEK